MTSVPGVPEGGRKRAYHTPTVHEFGSVSETTATFDSFHDDYIPTWFEQQPQNGPSGGGLS
jgi:hypothetical protein